MNQTQGNTIESTARSVHTIRKERARKAVPPVGDLPGVSVNAEGLVVGDVSPPADFVEDGQPGRRVWGALKFMFVVCLFVFVGFLRW